MPSPTLGLHACNRNSNEEYIFKPLKVINLGPLKLSCIQLALKRRMYLIIKNGIKKRGFDTRIL